MISSYPGLGGGLFAFLEKKKKKTENVIPKNILSPIFLRLQARNQQPQQCSGLVPALIYIYLPEVQTNVK